MVSLLTPSVRPASLRGSRPWVIVEISSESTEEVRNELIQAAYHLSRGGLVALALRGVSRQCVDRALDPVVNVREDPRHAVVYLTADDQDEDLMVAALHASLVIACSEAFRSELIRCGVEAGRVKYATPLAFSELPSWAARARH
jgi:hypothetical protein